MSKVFLERLSRLHVGGRQQNLETTVQKVIKGHTLTWSCDTQATAL